MNTKTNTKLASLSFFLLFLFSWQTNLHGQCDANGGEITGGPFEFCIDDEVDNVSDIGLTGAIGELSQWVITDPSGMILGLPPMPSVVDFNAAGTGICLIWNVSYDTGLEGLVEDGNIYELEGCHGISNSISVVRTNNGAACDPGNCTNEGGFITGGPFEFCVDGTPDMVSGLELSGTSGSNNQWLITDDKGLILGLPLNPEIIDFDEAGEGTCIVWNLNYETGIELDDGVNLFSEFDGCYSISNAIIVRRRSANGGTLTGGPFEFCVDGTPDMVSGIELTGNLGDTTQWVITDESGLILGLPPMPGVVDFDGAGAGTCLIYSISYNTGLTGLAASSNISDLVGCYALSNAVTVYRKGTEGGSLEGGPFEFCVDGVSDHVSDVSVSGNNGDLNQWVVTDVTGLILGLPGEITDVDFDGAGAGVCYIWNLTYSEGLEGLAMGNLVTDLDGCHGFSDSIVVTRTQVDGGSLPSETYYVCVDGLVDNLMGISVAGGVGANNQWVITDAAGKILGLPALPEDVDFDGAGTGICLIWHLSYEDGLDGLAMDANVENLSGCYDFSNPIQVIRTFFGAACDEACTALGGELLGEDYSFCVDGNADFVNDIVIQSSAGTNQDWVITDIAGKILGLPANPTDVNFDDAGAGTCLIWSISYEDGLAGLAADGNVFSDLNGCYSLSNAIIVTRTEANGGSLAGGPFEFCVDGTSDFVSDIVLSGNIGANSQWVITDVDGLILGLPPMPGAVDFDGAGAGICLIWHLSYEDGLIGLEAGNNVADLAGCHDFSDSISVTRTQVDGGTLVGGPFDFCVDGVTDLVSGVSAQNVVGALSQWVITDVTGMILGLPPVPEAVNFDEAGPGLCLIWNLSYAEGLENLGVGENVENLVGCYDFSDSIEVTRFEISGGVLEGGPFNFCVDDEADMVSDISLSGNDGENNQWVITDQFGTILGLPEMPGLVDFNDAGPGKCYIYHVSYQDGLTGLNENFNITELEGCFGLSNQIEVIRTDAKGGEITGGPFEFCVDGVADMVSDIDLAGNSGPNDQWLITDEAGNILGLPGMPGDVDFDGAGAGICLIWHMSYADGLEGLAMDNNVSDLVGCFDISNSISVTRTQVMGGSLEGGPFEFCVDGEADMVSGITLSDNSGAINQWLITDVDGNILGLPAMPGDVNFDDAGAGICLIWNISFDEDLAGIEVDNNVSDIVGCYGLSNSITVTRNTAIAGTVSGGPFEFCSGDGVSDFVTDVTVADNQGANSGWIVTDPDGMILGLPDSPEMVDFDVAGVGICFIWHISYADGLTGLEMSLNVNDLVGCFDISESIMVTRVDEGPLCISALEDEVFENVEIYPNPTYSNIRINLSVQASNNQGKVELFDLLGRAVVAKEIRSSDSLVEIDTESIASGTYFVKLSFDNASIVRKVVVGK